MGRMRRIPEIMLYRRMFLLDVLVDLMKLPVVQCSQCERSVVKNENGGTKSRTKLIVS